MKQMLYTQPLLEQQRRTLRKKKAQLWIVTAVWILLTVAVFLLLTRENQIVCTLINGLASGAYFSWLLYFLTFDYKKEREYARLIQETLSGRKKTVTGVVKAIETEENPLEKEYLIYFEQCDPEKGLRMYRLSGRENVQPEQWKGASLLLYVYQDRIAGIEVVL